MRTRVSHATRPQRLHRKLHHPDATIARSCGINVIDMRRGLESGLMSREDFTDAALRGYLTFAQFEACGCPKQ